MPKKRTSPVWKMSKQDFKNLVKKSHSKKEMLDFFGLPARGNNYRTLNKRIDEENCDIVHFEKNYSKMAKLVTKRKIPLKEILVKNSSYCRGHLKERILKNNLLENKCQICGLEPIWQNKDLTLILDHKNGIPDDNRLENLRLVCPNCNSQLSTHAGKNNKKRKKINHCSSCGKQISKRAALCLDCKGFQSRKTQWPSKEDLEEDIKNLSWLAIGKKYGVSDNAVKKWARKYQIIN